MTTIHDDHVQKQFSSIKLQVEELETNVFSILHLFKAELHKKEEACRDYEANYVPSNNSLFAKAMKENDKLRAENGLLRKNSKGKEAKETKETKETKEGKNELIKFQNENKELKASLENADELNNNLRKDIHEMNLKLENKQNEDEILKSKNKELLLTIEKLNKWIDKSNSEIESLKQHNEQLEKSLINVNNSSSSSSSPSEMDTTNKTNKEVHICVENTGEKDEEKEEENEEKKQKNKEEDRHQYSRIRVQKKEYFLHESIVYEIHSDNKSLGDPVFIKVDGGYKKYKKTCK